MASAGDVVVAALAELGGDAPIKERCQYVRGKHADPSGRETSPDHLSNEPIITVGV
jgi:hypothetical protein